MVRVSGRIRLTRTGCTNSTGEKVSAAAASTIAMVTTSLRPVDLFTRSGWWGLLQRPSQLTLITYQTLFQDPLMAVWVVLLFLALQQLEGHVVAPQVFGRALRINPLLVLLALLVGGEVYGIVGALVALPLAAVIRETIVYLREHVVLEPWGTPSYAAVRAKEKPPPDESD